MKPEVILWIYIVLLVIGGLIGFLKAKSKISLITSLLFGIALAVCAFDKLPLEVAWGILGFLSFFFLLRFLKSKKFMPGGMMMLLSFAALIAMVWFK